MLPHLLKSYLYLNDYKTLCIALRTLADTSDSIGQSLVRLHRSQRYALETEPCSENANFQQLVPTSAFLLNHKHLTCPLPWLENNSLLSIPTCLEILSDLLIRPQNSQSSLPVIRLASVSLFLRLESDTDLVAILRVIREILQSHAPTLKAISITVCSQAPRPHPLHRIRPVETLSETALPHSDLTTTTTTTTTTSVEISDVSSGGGSGGWGGGIPSGGGWGGGISEGGGIPGGGWSKEYIPLELENIVFPRLESLQLGLPISANGVKVPRITSLHLSYLNDEIISIWSKDVRDDQLYVQRQAEAIKKLIEASALTLRNITISGAVRLRAENRPFDAPVFLPSLVSVNLGWTTASELESLHQALLARERAQLREVLSYPVSMHTPLSKAETISDIAIQFTGTRGTTELPPRLPDVRHVVFNGPLRMGLTDRHLAIYAQVIPRGSQEELLLQYGILNVTIAGCLEFRRSLSEYCHCTIFRHPASLLHKILARRTFREPNRFREHSRAGLDFPSRHSKFKLTDLFSYEYITPDIKTNWRKVSKFDSPETAGGGWGDADVDPPLINEEMTGKDLFAIEFWQLPHLIRQDENQRQFDTVYDLWSSEVVPEILKNLYDKILAPKYVCERIAHYPFAMNLPWWEHRGKFRTKISKLNALG